MSHVPLHLPPPKVPFTDPKTGELTAEGRRVLMDLVRVATEARAGLLPALSGNAAHRLNGEGEWV